MPVCDRFYWGKILVMSANTKLLYTRKSEGIRGIKALGEDAEDYGNWYCKEPGATRCECEVMVRQPPRNRVVLHQ